MQELPVVNETDLKVKLFPNPVTNKLSVYVVGDNSPKILTLYDLSGKTIYTQQLNEMFTTLDLQKMAKGTYFIKITHPEGKVLYTEKVVKN